MQTLPAACLLAENKKLQAQLDEANHIRQLTENADTITAQLDEINQLKAQLEQTKEANKELRQLNDSYKTQLQDISDVTALNAKIAYDKLDDKDEDSIQAKVAYDLIIATLLFDVKRQALRIEEECIRQAEFTLASLCRGMHTTMKFSSTMLHERMMSLTDAIGKGVAFHLSEQLPHNTPEWITQVVHKVTERIKKEELDKLVDC